MSDAPTGSRRMLLVGWDAADWSLLHPLLDDGKLPTLARLVETGASGRLLCTEPPVGAAQWASLATGKRPWQHGICHGHELADDGRNRRPATAISRQSAALWEMLSHAGKKCAVVGWPTSHSTTAGAMSVVSDAYAAPTAGPGVKPWPPPPPGTYWPINLGSKLDPLRVSPADIQADVISQYIPAWQRINQRLDQRLGQLRLMLAADFSFFAAAAELLHQQRLDFMAVRFPALGQIARFFLPFHPPKRATVSAEDFDLYRHVMAATCRMLDLLLQRLIQLAGTDTTVVVVSGHGTRSFDLPPQGPPPESAEIWKSPYGIFAAGGNGFAPDALLHGATVLDVAPTILAWFGLPIGDDMEGRVLIESLVTVPDIARKPTWDPASAESAAPFPATSAPPDSPASGQPDSAADIWRGERDWNFIRSCLEAGQFDQAMPVLKRLFAAFPERAAFGQTLFECQLELKQLADAHQTLEVLLESIPPGVPSLVLRAELAWAERDPGTARALVAEALRSPTRDPGLLRRLGILLLRLRQWDQLADLARQGIALDEQEPVAWLALAAALLRQGQPGEAADAASRAIGLKYFLPEAHFILVRALVAQGQWIQARAAMEALLKMQPNNRAATLYAQRISPAAPGAAASSANPDSLQ